MKTNFSIEQIAEIAKKLRMYKKLSVTTRGQMFRVKRDAEEALRTINMVIDDVNDHVGLLEMDEGMVTDDKLKLFSSSTKLFDKLFENAKIPLDKDNEKKDHVRKREDVTSEDKEIASSVDSILKAGKSEAKK